MIAFDGGYVLVQEAKPSARQRLSLPAGKPEPGEELAEAAVREAREECGLDVVVEDLVGIYHCPRTSEGYGVVNFIFASRAVGGELTSSVDHPLVQAFNIEEIKELDQNRRLRGAHILPAVQAFEAGERMPLSLVGTVAASPFPTS